MVINIKYYEDFGTLKHTIETEMKNTYITAYNTIHIYSTYSM